MIRAKDPRLHCISVAYKGFVVPDGILIPEGTPLNEPLFVATPSVGASSTQPVPQEEEGELKEEEEEEEKSRGGCRFIRVLRRIRGIQPNSIPRGYSG